MRTNHRPSGALLILAMLFALFAGSAARAGFTDAQMNLILQDTKDGVSECEVIDVHYQLDCLRQVVAKTAKDLDGQSRHRDSKMAMLGLQRQMNRIVKSAEDKAAPRTKVGRRTYRPIKQAALRAANAAARKAVDETVTRLLKSDSKAHLQYVKIAEVVGSTKVMLRS